MKYRDQVKIFELAYPGPTATAVMQKRISRGQRYGSLTDIPKLSNLCKWCELKPAKSRFYCSPYCSDSANAWVNPQKSLAKAYLLLVKQSCACAGCKEDFSDELDRRAERKLKRGDGNIYPEDRIQGWWLVQNSGHLWHVDHIVPIHKGGSSLGLDNCQVLCVRCHRKKTVQERRDQP